MIAGNEIYINIQPKINDSQLNGNPNFVNNLNLANEKELKSIGYYFDGIQIQEKRESPVYGSINAVNKFNDLSFEELRLNDYTFAKTGLLPQQPTFFKRKENNSPQINSNGLFGENHNNNIFEFNPNIFNFNNNSFMSNSNSNFFIKSNEIPNNNVFNNGNNNFGFFGSNNGGSIFENKNIENGGSFFDNSNNFGRLFENNNNNSGFFGNINNENKFSFFNDNSHNNQISNNGGIFGNVFNNNINEGTLGYNNNTNCGLYQNNTANGGLYENNNSRSAFSIFNNHDNDNSNDNNLLGAQKNIFNNIFGNQNNNDFIGNGSFANSNNNMNNSIFGSQRNNISLFRNQDNNSIQFSFGVKNSNSINNNNCLFNNINNSNNLFLGNNGINNNNNLLFCNINNNNNNNTNSLFGNINNNQNENQKINLFGGQSLNNDGNGLFINQPLFNNQNSFSNENGGFDNKSLDIFSFSQNESISTQPTSFLGRKSSLLEAKDEIIMNNNSNNLDINNNSYSLNNNYNYSYNNNNNNENKDSNLIGIINLNENKNISHAEKRRKSLGEILLNKMKEQEELDLLSYNSNYKQEKIDEENKNELNKYKYEISSANNININPGLKNNLISIKEYFNKTGNRFRPYRSKSNSFDISINYENKVLSNLENSFSRKLSIGSQKKKEKKTIKIACHIKEPHKVNFSLLLGKKVEISVLKQTICDQLAKKNSAYASLKSNSFCLMKNYMFVQEFGTIGDTILSDGDDVYIILKESMNKCQVEEK